MLTSSFVCIYYCTYGTTRLACILSINRLNFVSPRLNREFIILKLHFQQMSRYTPAMTTSKTISAIPCGFAATPVIIECSTSKGLNAFTIVGMANKTIDESRERIRFALKNSGFNFPSDHLTINLAPASLQKTGSYLDLPIAVAILAHSRQLQPKNIQNTAFIGELALDGKIRPIRGILNAVESLAEHKIKQIILPAANYPQASLLGNKIKLIPVSTLTELWQYLELDIEPANPE